MFSIFQIFNVSTKTVASESQKGSFECNVSGQIQTRHYDLLRHRQPSKGGGLQARTTTRITTPAEARVLSREDVTSSFDATLKVSPKGNSLFLPEESFPLI